MLLRGRLTINYQWARKRYFILATSAIFKSATATTCLSTTQMAVTSFPLLDKWQQSHNTWLLRFGLPEDQKILGKDPLLPTCISVQQDSQVGLLRKSYSPVSHPATKGTFDLLVKSYPPVHGGGVGDAICKIEIGQLLVGKLKAERLVHGSPVIGKRWNEIGLIAGGTGVAPLIQLARIILDDPTDETKVHVSVPCATKS